MKRIFLNLFHLPGCYNPHSRHSCPACAQTPHLSYSQYSMFSGRKTAKHCKLLHPRFPCKIVSGNVSCRLRAQYDIIISGDTLYGRTVCQPGKAAYDPIGRHAHRKEPFPGYGPGRRLVQIKNLRAQCYRHQIRKELVHRCGSLYHNGKRAQLHHYYGAQKKITCSGQIRKQT